MDRAKVDKNDTPAAKGEGKRRIFALDLMRGYFILVIASIHLAYYPSFLGTFDGRGQLWVSEAEGFFLISGLLIGIIRRSDIRKGGYRLAVMRMWQRGAKLYLASIALSFLYLTIAAATNALHIAGAKGGLDWSTSVFSVILRVLTLEYSYGWADFLGYYAAFMLLAPVVVGLLYRRLWWIVGLTSIGIYVLRWSGDFGALNPFMQWQVYFFIGSILGYYWTDLSAAMARLSQSLKALLSRLSMATSAAVMAFSSFIVFTPAAYATRDLPHGQWGRVVHGLQTASTNTLYDSLLLHGRVGLLRPLIALVVFAGMLAFVLRFERQIMRYGGKLLLPFGQNSLYVYIVQSLILFAIPFFLAPGNYLLNTAIEILIITLAWLGIRYRVLFKLIPR